MSGKTTPNTACSLGGQRMDCYQWMLKQTSGSLRERARPVVGEAGVAFPRKQDAVGVGRIGLGRAIIRTQAQQGREEIDDNEHNVTRLSCSRGHSFALGEARRWAAVG